MLTKIPKTFSKSSPNRSPNKLKNVSSQTHRQIDPMDSASESLPDHRRSDLVRRIDRERLLRYIADLIKIQKTPLRVILRDHALPHLPAQSLLRFRSVSRSWNQLISSPFFAHTQSHTHRSLSGLFFHVNEQISYLPFQLQSDSVPDPSLSFIPDSISTVASSNGLVACRSLVSTWRYYVCNPATKKWTAIPRPPQGINGVIALVFHPSALNFSARYYLIGELSHPFGLTIFSSESATWRTSNAWVPESAHPLSSVAVGGVAYWRTTRGSVAAYDPTADRLSIMAPPDFKAVRWQLVETGSNLCGVVAREGIVEVWELVTESATWTKVSSLNVPGDPWPLVCEGKEDRVIVWMDGRIIRIDWRRGESTVVIREGLPNECVDSVPYISSLVTVGELCYGEEGCFTCRLHRDGEYSSRAERIDNTMFS